MTAVVFDLGGVVVDWDPRHLYSKLFDHADEMDHFLGEVCTLQWHAQHDRGRPMSETIPPLREQHPGYGAQIDAWRSRYVEMIAGYVAGMPDLIEQLRGAGTKVYALTNMPAEVIHELRAAYPIIERFDGIVVSGEELVVKPDPAIYRLLTTRFGLVPRRTVFVDDLAVNVDAAWELGFRAVRFESAAKLRHVLTRWGVPMNPETSSIRG